jgi:hypothetical protein
LTSETNSRSLVNFISIVDESTVSGEVDRRNERCWENCNFQDPDNLIHAHTDDPMIKELMFMHEDSLFYVGMNMILIKTTRDNQGQTTLSSLVIIRK